MSPHFLAPLAPLARTRHGTFSLGEATALGITRRQLSRATGAGLLHQVRPRVWAFAGAADTDALRCWAAHLQAGPESVVSHEAALRSQGVEHLPEQLALLLPAGVNRTIPGVRIHRVSDLRPHHVVRVDGLPVTSVARSLVDLAGVFSPSRMDWLLDELIVRERIVSVAAVAAVLGEVNRLGRRGLTSITTAVATRSAGGPTPRSTLERHLWALIVRSGLPAPVREHPLPTAGAHPGLVDVAFPEVQLIVEVDGRRWHSRLADMAKDRARDREAGRMGWLTVRVLDEELTQQPEVVQGDILAVYEARARQIRQAA